MSKSKLVKTTVLNGLNTTKRIFRNAIYKDLNVGDLGAAFSALEDSGLVKKIYVKGAVAYEKV